MTLLAVAAVSARVLAEAAVRDGFEVVALDLFGDVDTCRAASRWMTIGEAGSLQIDPARVLDALRMLARRGDVEGWVAGSGFEAWPELLREGAALLPLLGTAADRVQRVRDPFILSNAVTALGFAMPAVRSALPEDASGWLVKDARGLGGWHIRRASPHDEQTLPDHHYAQREQRGVPMSATFIAGASDVSVLGFNRLIVQAMGERPFVYGGVVGPVVLPAEVAREVGAAVRGLAIEFGLRGLASLDFLLDGECVHLLEINPRPPASMALYAALPLFAAHVDACRDGRLPDGPGPSTSPVRGTEIVFARQPFMLGERVARRLADAPEVHDLPCAGARFAAGDPVCSVDASGRDADAVMAQLAAGREALLKILETCS